ncbi:hypothetical protein D3C80_2193370 [compost metagenome]
MKQKEKKVEEQSKQLTKVQKEREDYENKLSKLSQEQSQKSFPTLLIFGNVAAIAILLFAYLYGKASQ